MQLKQVRSMTQWYIQRGTVIDTFFQFNFHNLQHVTLRMEYVHYGADIESKCQLTQCCSRSKLPNGAGLPSESFSSCNNQKFASWRPGSGTVTVSKVAFLSL